MRCREILGGASNFTLFTVKCIILLDILSWNLLNSDKMKISFTWRSYFGIIVHILVFFSSSPWFHMKMVSVSFQKYPTPVFKNFHIVL